MKHGCCNTSGYSTPRHFLTRDEKIDILKEYKDQLELEAKGIGERITSMEKNN